MGQRRVEETLVSQAEAARLLGVEPEEIVAVLRRHRVKSQKVRVAEREAVVYGLADVAVNGREDAPVKEVFVGTSTIAEILGKPLGNVVKMLDRRNLEKQTVTVGRRSMAIYLRDDVMRVQRQEAKRQEARV